ncbi:MAG: sigma-70 family RNA polymerase sigma factor [Lachnospiraceae bacterium]|jgi:RNA polymerase sigma factor, sigma-70 family|nr:sigma-70 family RNA polymerase sigma factor [Lachnospiraceae bacterium]
MRIREDNYIEQLCLQNEEALLYVIDVYGGLIKSVISKHLFAMPDKIDECLDDVLLNIWENISSFDESRSTFKNWAAAVAKYRAVDYLRKYRQELQQVNIEDVLLPQEDAMLERLVQEEISEEMESLLSCLSESDRSLFWKLYVEEKPIEEVSQETGMKKAVIYNRISRGKRRVRKQYLNEREA